MLEQPTDKWWDIKAHRRVRGARGSRLISPRGHVIMYAAFLALYVYVVRLHDDDNIYRTPAPPVEAPPPLPHSLPYTMTAEMPYLKSIEIERSIPEHVPQVSNIDVRKIKQIVL